MTRELTRLLIVGALLQACGGEAREVDAAGSDAPGGDAPVLEVDAGPDLPAGPPGRAVHRMTVEQLARSIPVVTGGIAWTEDFGGGPLDILGFLAPTLGAPDYTLVVSENLEPSLLIAKFMQDASQRICAKWVTRDRERPPGERTLIVHDDWDSTAEADVKQSLRALELRFFSRRIAPGDDAPIADLYQLFTEAAAAAPPGKGPDDGWLGVCIAMMTDPAFVLY
ncbi:MAG: hypothetical protein H6746_04875 [Deltaproteobacteria bacterium]|nr:hypothetical protein [Deltaproteobacteria bacterium]